MDIKKHHLHVRAVPQISRLIASGLDALDPRPTFGLRLRPFLRPNFYFSHIEIIESPLLRFHDSNKTENHKHRRKLHLNSLGEKFYLDLWKIPLKHDSLETKEISFEKPLLLLPRKVCPPQRYSTVAISLCDGVRGYIQTSDASYAIQPLPQHIVQRLNKNVFEKPHIVVRREISPDTFCPHALRKHNKISLMNNTASEILEPEIEEAVSPEERNESSSENKTRERRSTASKMPSIIETAVFIDQALYDQMRRTFPSDTDRQMTTFVLTMMNAELRPSDNIDTYLTNFCIWQHNRRHYGRGKSPRWDHALLLSGIDVHGSTTTKHIKAPYQVFPFRLV
ncbi:pep_M12B_propep domain-containing protein [Caerostris extrusa]|uniref:Pep_M12B_propep domain-containing protein n=1 Tax=Caerostris extrusa TaxID=172846 RepID=A0AAV4MA81_CAEEX|nr:pep_M12B_propep domain-containing protein [Caerostris extrusa]